MLKPEETKTPNDYYQTSLPNSQVSNVGEYEIEKAVTGSPNSRHKRKSPLQIKKKIKKLTHPHATVNQEATTQSKLHINLHDHARSISSEENIESPLQNFSIMKSEKVQDHTECKLHIVDEEKAPQNQVALDEKLIRIEFDQKNEDPRTGADEQTLGTKENGISPENQNAMEIFETKPLGTKNRPHLRPLKLKKLRSKRGIGQDSPALKEFINERIRDENPLMELNSPKQLKIEIPEDRKEGDQQPTKAGMELPKLVVHLCIDTVQNENPHIEPEKSSNDSQILEIRNYNGLLDNLHNLPEPTLSPSRSKLSRFGKEAHDSSNSHSHSHQDLDQGTTLPTFRNQPCDKKSENNEIITSLTAIDQKPTPNQLLSPANISLTTYIIIITK